MKLYFYSNSHNQAVCKTIRSYLKKLGMEIISAGDKVKNGAILADVDFLFLHDLPLDSHSSYLLAMGLAQNKDVICFVPKGKKIDPTLQTFLDNKILAKKLHLIFYEQKNVLKGIEDFFESFDLEKLNEVVNIKYTLRLSNQINDYLNWRAKKSGIPKADWIREQIRKIMLTDKDYQTKSGNHG